MLERLHWLGHGSFLIEGPPLIYINPWRVTRGTFHADAILIGHDHYEHFSPADIEKLRGPDTVIATNEKVGAMVAGSTQLRTWHSLTLDRARITAVPAYSVNDPRHALDEGGLGFVISLNFYDIYYAGDTGVIPEMQGLQPDIAILPIDGANGTLSVEQAVEVVKQMRPRTVLPCNWGAGGEG
ncbi:MAG: MBL fold metallo-hydrolase, partial [Armatimonadetes bacterium]|nr:MBL fold metallo-hydrolase [Anaerolineae bacterium]